MVVGVMVIMILLFTMVMVVADLLIPMILLFTMVTVVADLLIPMILLFTMVMVMADLLIPMILLFTMVMVVTDLLNPVFNRCGKQGFAIQDKCFVLLEPTHERSTYNEARSQCYRQTQGSLASFATREDWLHVMKVLFKYRTRDIIVGLRTSGLSFMWVWSHSFFYFSSL